MYNYFIGASISWSGKVEFKKILGC